MQTPRACGHWVDADDGDDRCQECHDLGSSPDPWDMVEHADTMRDREDARRHRQTVARSVYGWDLALGKRRTKSRTARMVP